MSIKDRLQMVMKMHSLTNAGFADRVGVQRSSISHIMAGRNKPSLDFIQKTLLAFPRVNAQWLITGKQEASQHEVVTASVNEKKDPENTATKASEVKEHENAKEREIERIVVFYSDGTYQETRPESKTE